MCRGQGAGGLRGALCASLCFTCIRISAAPRRNLTVGCLQEKPDDSHGLGSESRRGGKC